MRIAHLTDPHLTSLDEVSLADLLSKRALGYLSWWRRRRHQHRRDSLDALTAHLEDSAPDLIFVTGDLVHIGLPAEIRVAQAWLARLARITRVVLVPGNHDCYHPDSPAIVHAAWEGYLHARPNDRDGFPTVTEIGDVSVIGLSSAMPMPPWSAQGRVGAAQLGRIDRVLDDSAGRFRCVGLHHPPMPGAAPRRKALSDAPELAELLARHGVEIVLHGHLHRNAEAVLAERTRVFATASCSRASGPERASYRLFDIDRGPAGWNVTRCVRRLEADGSLSNAAHGSWTAPDLAGAATAPG